MAHWIRWIALFLAIMGVYIYALRAAVKCPGIVKKGYMSKGYMNVQLPESNLKHFKSSGLPLVLVYLLLHQIFVLGILDLVSIPVPVKRYMFCLHPKWSAEFKTQHRCIVTLLKQHTHSLRETPLDTSLLNTLQYGHWSL